LVKGKLTAKVKYRMGYQGGDAILKKEENKKSKATWVE